MAKFNNQPSYRRGAYGHSNYAGVGSATLLVVLAKNIPEGYPIKSWLVIAAPSITVAVSFLWRLTANEVRRFIRNKRINKFNRSLLIEIEIMLKDPTLPACERQRLLNKKQEIKFSKIEELTRQLANIRATA